MEQNLIFCFSGTGNSVKAAKDIAATLGNTDVVLMKEAYKLTGKYDRIGFVFPSYAGGVPKAVLSYIRMLGIDASSAEYFFTVVTCGGAPRDSVPMLRNALAKKGVVLQYGKALPSVGNYISMYPLAPDVIEKLRLADEKCALYAQEIKEKAATDIGKTKLGTTLFYKAGQLYFRANAKKHTVSDTCTSCALCEKLCPTKSIRMENGRPVFSPKSCAQCMACIQWCPASAINCSKETVGRVRYRHPDIRADELF